MIATLVIMKICACGCGAASETRSFGIDCVRQVLQIGGHEGRLGGLAEVSFLVLSEISHVEVAVSFEPILVGLDGEGADQAQACS